MESNFDWQIYTGDHELGSSYGWIITNKFDFIGINSSVYSPYTHSIYAKSVWRDIQMRVSPIRVQYSELSGSVYLWIEWIWCHFQMMDRLNMTTNQQTVFAFYLEKIKCCLFLFSKEIYFYWSSLTFLLLKS